MKRTIVFAALLSQIVFFFSCEAPDDKIVIENNSFKLVVNSNCIVENLIVKDGNENLVSNRENIPLFSVTQERPYHNEIKLGYPNKKTTFDADTIYRDGDRLIVGFNLVPYKAVIKLENRDEYISFSLDSFYVAPGTYPSYMKLTPPPATELTLLQLPIKNQERFGEWLNVMWNNNYAVGVLAGDEYTQIENQKMNDFRIMRAVITKEIGFKHSSAVLIAGKSDKFLDNVAALEKSHNLPNGVGSRRSNNINASYYWSADINPSNVREHIRYAKMGGFRYMLLYYTCFERQDGYSLIGNYEMNTDMYPNGESDLKDMIDTIKANGIIPGVHFLHSHIGVKSKYVTPVPDDRINTLRSFYLSESFSETDTIIYVDQNPEGCVLADGCRILKVGKELVSYESYTTEYPYKFTGCKRAVFNTTVNPLEKGGIVSLLDVSEFGATSVYINQETSLQDEVAEKIARFYNLGFRFIYFDGSEGVNAPFGYNISRAQYKVYKRLTPEPLFAEGAAKTHFSWHMLSGGNAFDVFPPETIKEMTIKWPLEEAKRMENDFTRINFGWLAYFLPSESSVGSQPDMFEFVTSKAAACNSPISVQANLSAFGIHPRSKDIFEVVRRWEEVRKSNWLTEKQKSSLKEADKEFTLLIDENGNFELVEYAQILSACNGSSKIRAFIFERGNENYVVYWHTNSNQKIKIRLDRQKCSLYSEIGVNADSLIADSDGYMVLPLSDKYYIKCGYSKSDILKAFENAEIVD